jgi:hypothetical protein
VGDGAAEPLSDDVRARLRAARRHLARLALSNDTLERALALTLE